MSLPNASKIVFASKICCSTQVDTPLVTEHKYCNMNLVFSVLPAPLSPLMTKLWFLLPLPGLSVCRDAYAASPRANTCGSIDPNFFPWYFLTYVCKSERIFINKSFLVWSPDVIPITASSRGRYSLYQYIYSIISVFIDANTRFRQNTGVLWMPQKSSICVQFREIRS